MPKIFAFRAENIQKFIRRRAIKNERLYTIYCRDPKTNHTVCIRHSSFLAQRDIQIFLDRNYIEWSVPYTDEETKCFSGNSYTLELHKEMDIIPWMQYYKVWR